MKRLQNILGIASAGLALASTNVSADLIKWKTDTEDQRVKLDTTTINGKSSVGSWNATPFYGDSVEYLILARNPENKDYFGNALIDFFHVDINGKNGVTDYLITLNQDTNLDGTIDYSSQHYLSELLNDFEGKLSLAQQEIPKKYDGLVGKMTIQAIPEPTAMALMGFAGFGSIALSRLRLRKSTAQKFALDYSALDSIDFPRKK